MYLNKFSVRVVGGNETSSGYVEMRHGKVYKLCLRNSRRVRCDAQVEIDGKDVGTWRIPSCSSITLERPADDDGEFTFYKVGTLEARQAALDVRSDNLGLIAVTFSPERARRVVKPLPSVPETPPWPTSPPQWGNTEDYPEFFGSISLSAEFGGDEVVVACAGGEPVRSRGRGGSAGAPKSLSAGGTGLSGQSNQRFGTTGMIEYDYTQQTTIHLRLVAQKDDGPRPLVARSNPKPPRFY